MLPSAQSHIAETEAKETARRLAAQESQSRDQAIANARRGIAEAIARKEAPVFASEDAETSYRVMKDKVEAVAEKYVHELWSARQSGRPIQINLDSEGAIAFFFQDQIVEKLAVLADRISSRNCRGLGLNEAKRAEFVEACDALIAQHRATLARLGADE